MNRFGDYTPHGNICIGETLDELLNGQCIVESIPHISVAQRNGKWFTSDNRRLWVFRKAEEIGFLKTIYVDKTNSIKDDKFTTKDGGTSIRVRGGSPGGSLWRRWKPKRPSTTKTHVSYNSNRVEQKYHQSHVEYNVRKNNERNEEVPYRFNSNVETTRPAALPSRFNRNVETTRPAALPSRFNSNVKTTRPAAQPSRVNSYVETRPAALPSRFNSNVETPHPAAQPSRFNSNVDTTRLVSHDHSTYDIEYNSYRDPNEDKCCCIIL
jgi:hypothetical protein